MACKLLHIFSFLLIFNHALTLSVFSQTQSPVDYPKDRVIVKFKNNLSANALNDIRTAMGVQKSTSLSLIGAEVWQLSGPTADETIASLINNPTVEYIEPDYTLYAVTPVFAAADTVQVFPDDPRFPEMWGLHNTGQRGGTPDTDIDAPEAWAVTTGKEIVVGVIDSGTDWLHEDLADNIWANPGEIPDNGIDDDKNGFVDDVRGWDFFDDDNDPRDEAGHGTHVTGTIAAVGNNNIGTVGVNWAAKIMILRFLGPNGSGSTSDAIQAIDYAVRMNAHLTNNSWGGGQFSQALKDAIEAAGNAGQLFVAAAGNTGQNSDLLPNYPASYDLDNIISVANLTRFNQLFRTSTFGVTTVDLAAPGTSVLSTLPGNQYANFSGTSMASPHVAGTASLILSIDPSISPLDIKDLILSTVDSVNALQGLVATGGRLNAYKAVISADPDSIPPAPVTDLQAVDPTSNSITASWTASGDDSTVGTAAAYEIRYSTKPIDAGNFDFATVAANPPAPQEAGSAERFVIKDLDFNTNYYVALRVIDNLGNVSEISNTASATTLGAPNIAISPDSLSEELLTGATSTQSFTIKNDAEGTLDFDISIEGISSSAADNEGWYIDDVTVNSKNFVLWLSVAPESGTVVAGDSAEITVTFDALGLNAGGFDAKINISSNDPDDATVSIPVHLNVIGAPDIFAKIDTLDFGGIFTGQQDTLNLQVENRGTDDLEISNIAAQPSEFSVTPNSESLAPGDALTLSIIFAPVNPGILDGSLVFTSNDPDESTFTIALRGEGVPPPVIAVSPDSLDEHLFTGEMSRQTLALANTGGSDLNFAIDLEGVENAEATVLIRNVPSSSETANRNRRYLEAGVSHFQDNGLDIPPDSAPVVLPPGSIRPNAETLPFRDSFEDGDFADWFTDDTTGEREVTASTAGRGRFSFTYRNVIQGHFHGIHQEFEPGQPEYISFFIRSGSTSQSDAYFVLTANGNARNTVIFFFARGSGFFFANGSTPGGDESFAYNANQWYQIEFKEINWTEKHFDYYVDGKLIKAAIPFRNAGLVNDMDKVFVYNFAANAQGWWDDITIGDPGTLWLDANPLAGTVAANSQVEIEVFFDAAGLIGDDYRANLVISSNDPVTPKVTVPVLLEVANAPDIALSGDSLDYGEVFTGVTIADTVFVFNAGTDTLEVTSITVDHSDFSLDPVSFDLPPDEQQPVAVLLNASAPGNIAATMTISSNDPDEAEVQIPLSATVLIPPKIAVAPDSLSQALFTGGKATQILTISNENADGDTLDFSLSVVQKDSAANSFSVQYRFSGMAEVKNNSQNLPDRSWGEHSVFRAKASGSRAIQEIDAAGNANLPVVISDPVGDGGPVDVIALRAQSDAEFVEFQVDFSTVINPVDFGGALSLDIDQNPKTGTPPSFGIPGQDIGAEFEFFFFNLGAGLVDLFRGSTFINSYPVVVMEKSIRFATPLFDLGNDDGIMDVTGVLGTSSGPTDWFPDNGHGTIQKGVSWLVPSLFSGNIPGGASLEIEVTFDANGLQGGDYLADIAIFSNDPFSPLVNIPAHLMVTGAADISLSDSLLNFGEVFIDFSKQDSVVVSNTGTKTLEITSIISDNPEFSVAVSSLSIEPEASHTVLVTFAPKTETTSTGVLVFSSNDPDEPAAEVAVTGEGLLPPDISVSPGSFTFFVNPEDSATAVLTITNEGGSLLKFALRDEEQEVIVQASGENLFWSVGSNIAADTLYRSDIDGTDPEAIFLGEGLLGIAIDRQEKIVYWAHAGDGTIRASNFDGSNERTIIRGLESPVEISLDKTAGKIYWTDFILNQIARANLDGSEIEIIVSGGATASDGSIEDVIGNEAYDRDSEKPLQLENPWGLALDLANKKIYWTEQTGDRIGRANLDGSDEEYILTPVDTINGPRGIEIDPAQGKIYFVDSFNKAIKRANPDGSQIETLLTFTSAENPLSLDLDRNAQKFYWSDNGPDYISRADYDGGNVEIVVRTNVSGFSGPFGVAVSAGSGWLSEDPTQGLLIAGESAEIALKVNTARLEEGEYQATIFVESNDPDESRVEIPVALSVNKAQVVFSIPDNLETLPGDTLDIPVSIVLLDSSLEITALGVAMKATGEVLTFLGHTSGPILPGQALSLTNPSPDSVRMGFLALNRAPLAQSGLLATLHFQVDDTANGGEHTLKLSDISASAPNGQAIPVASLNGKVTIITSAIAGTVLYCEPDGAGDPAKPVPDLEVELISAGNALQKVKTSLSGEYNLSNIRPAFDYRVEAGRQAGGTGSAVTPTDALLVVQAFLGTATFSGCQNLAADADGNRTVNPVDAGLIFNRFLGRIAQFPVADWRAYPSNYNINAPADAWKNVPGGKDYPNLQQSLSEQDFLAVAIGDVDLSWPEAAPGSSANLIAKGNGESAALHLLVAETALSPFTNEATVQIYLDGPALANGVFALGGELQYDATALEILSVRWGEVVPKEGFRTDFRAFAASQAESQIESEAGNFEAADGRLRFGGFSTSQAKINTAGVLLEVDVRLIGEHDPGTVLLLELTDCSAAFESKSTPSSNQNTGTITHFANATVSATGGALAVSAMPKSFALEENYPNPFNPATRIRYQLPEAAKVKIEIYNALGHKILTLVDSDAQKAGFYAIDWHGRDAAGRAVASGVYLYRIEAISASQAFTKTRKMLLIK
jgi:subtilisin family serine protease